MRSRLALLLLFVPLASTASAQPRAPDVDSPAVSTAETPKDTRETPKVPHGTTSGLPGGVALDAEAPDLDEILKDVPHLITAVKDAMGAKAQRLAAWMAALAVLMQLLVGLLRRYGGAIFHSKQVPRIAVLAGGFLAFAFAYFAGGWQGWEAAVLALGPPLGIVTHEICKLLKPSKWRDFLLKATELATLRRS